MIRNRLNFLRLRLFPRGWVVESFDWRFRQSGFDPSFGNLACLATMKSSDRTKLVCLWMTIYIYGPTFIKQYNEYVQAQEEMICLLSAEKLFKHWYQSFYILYLYWNISISSLFSYMNKNWLEFDIQYKRIYDHWKNLVWTNLSKHARIYIYIYIYMRNQIIIWFLFSFLSRCQICIYFHFFLLSSKINYCFLVESP